MKCACKALLLGCLVLLGVHSARAQDWPQWRGPNRDGKAAKFAAPKDWPKELTKKWKVTVGDGVASPALVGDKLFVFTRQDKSEIVRCLDAATGKELWQDKYDAQAVSGPASGFPGPRGSPVVADGKVVTLGVGGVVSCLDAASGKLLWRKDDFKGNWPRFFTSCSPIVADGLCVVQLGGESKGGIVAYDLGTGAEKWKWTGDGTAYASPALLAQDGARAIVAETANKIVALGPTDGKLLWETPFPLTKGGYNAATPMVEGQTLIYTGSGRGTRAVQIEKKGNDLAAKPLWENKDHGVMYNTPIVKDGLVFGISERSNLFCLSAADGKTAWSSAIGRANGYGSVVDVGPVLLALTPTTELVVFEPSAKEFKQVAKYKVGDGDTYAYPIPSGNRIFVKDRTTLTLWTVE